MESNYRNKAIQLESLVRELEAEKRKLLGNIDSLRNHIKSLEFEVSGHISIRKILKTLIERAQTCHGELKVVTLSFILSIQLIT